MLIAPAPGRALVDVPPLTARVQDQAGVLAPGEVTSLEAMLATFERETGHQIAILTLPTLDGEAIEAFAIRVASAWKLGDADRDDGILVVVAVEDRKARIEVGYGLEGSLPDALTSRIVRERMTPRFREGAMGEGLRAGVEAIMAATKGEALPAAPDAGGGREGQDAGDGMAHGVLIATLIGVFVGSQLTRRRRGLAPVASGLLAALVAWLITSLLPAVLLATVAAIALSIVFAASGPGRGLRGGPTVFGPGGFGGGGFGGGGFGGGGFGGGGGGFGGGGASGDW